MDNIEKASSTESSKDSQEEIDQPFKQLRSKVKATIKEKYEQKRK